MEDYINYIDFSAIQLGKLAEETGDCRLAEQCYTKALKRLRNYPGDSMVAVNMGAELQRKVDGFHGNPVTGRSVLIFEKWLLSKTSFVKGNQCRKYLYLDKYNKSDRTKPSAETMALFKMGHSLEDRFRDLRFPKGINIKEKAGNFAYFNSYTRHLLSMMPTAVLYEGTIIEDGVMVMVDVLVKNSDQSLDFYEVKLSPKLTDFIVHDLALQYYICRKRFGDAVSSFNVVMRDPGAENNFIVMDLKDQLELLQQSVQERIADFREVLNLPSAPQIATGAHCTSPYNCEFIAFCSEKTAD